MKGLICKKRKGFPASISFSMSTLAVIVLVSGALLLGVNGRLDPTEEKIVKDNFQLIKEMEALPYGDHCFDDVIDKMIGERPAYGEEDHESPYFKLQQAYHATPPSNTAWQEYHIIMPQRREFIIEARELQEIWAKIQDFQPDDCEKALIDATDLDGTDKDAEGKANATVISCGSKHKLSNQIRNFPRKHLEDKIYRTCYGSVTLVIDAIFETVYPESFRRIKAWDWDLFDQMYEETLEFDLQIHDRITSTFPAFIKKLTDEGKTEEATAMQKKLNEIKDRLQDPSLPYYDLYFDGDEEIMEIYRYDDGVTALFNRIGQYFINDSKKLIYGKEYSDYVEEWDRDITTFLAALGDGKFSTYVDYLVDEVWGDLLDVKLASRQTPPTPADMYDANGVLVKDALWNWEYRTNWIHNMRLAWDLMGAVLEELKCYMRETYYFDLRPEALRRTQRNLTEGALFSGISRTIQAPCRIIDDLDLTGPYCTRENNEICSPITPLRDDQRTSSIHHGGLGLTKPRWIYKYDPLTYDCGKGRKDYVMRVNTCRCGFRLDCGADLNVSITCQLVHNDLLRGQCRGSVGYPCKTLPLAPGKHNETCLSGYCNMKKNSCEDRPFLRRPFGGAARPEMKMNVGILVGLMAYFVGFILCQLIF